MVLLVRQKGVFVMYKQLTDTINNIKNKHIIIFFIFLSLFEHINTFIHDYNLAGIQYGGDVERYNAWANGIIEKGLQYYAENIDKPYYWGYASIMALFRIIFRNDICLIFFQIAAISLSVVLIYKTAVLLFTDRNKLAVILVCFMYSTFPDYVTWSHNLYSDTFGIVLMTSELYLLIYRRTLPKEKRKGNTIAIIVLAVLFFTIRTNSSVMITILVISLLSELPKKARITAVAVLVVLGAAFLGEMLINSSGEHGLAQRIEYYRDLYREGIIVYESMAVKTYPVDPSHYGTIFEVFDILKILLIRFFYFWAFALKEATIYEKIVNTAMLFPVIVFGFIGMFLTIKNKIKPYYILVVIVESYHLVHIFFEIDRAYRYRMPVFPAMFMLAAYGGTTVLKLLLDKYDKAVSKTAFQKDQ